MNHPVHDERATCAECGAPMIDGLTCWEQLGMLIAWEHDDTDLQREHFLTVASYNLQHPAQFTDQAIAGLRRSLAEYLEHGVSVQHIRQRTSAAFEGNRRVLRPVAERIPVPRRWSITIADVYLPDRPEGAAERVRAWGASIRSEV